LVNRAYVAAAYNPATKTWRRLPSPPAWADGVYGYTAVWTGKEMLVWGQGVAAAFNPQTTTWRRLPRPPMDGAATVVWTGREMIGWGGGCCGDAWSFGAAYNPATNTWRKLPVSPLHGDQHPVGAWTGREFILLVGGNNPVNDKPWPAQFATAAAYNPTTDTWRRVAPMPATRDGATAVWDGRDVLVVGGANQRYVHQQLMRTGFAYNPVTNRWRSLAPMESGRVDFAAAWTGKRLLIWGGRNVVGGWPQSPPRGLAYDPSTDHWSVLAKSPLRGRLNPTCVWTGHTMFIWGGGTQRPPYRSYTDGAVFTPAR
jgi:N-acetylneuraminic acid mutarotase